MRRLLMNVYDFVFWTADYTPYRMDVSVVANTMDDAYDFIRETRPNTRIEKVALNQRDVIIINPPDNSIIITNPAFR